LENAKGTGCCAPSAAKGEGEKEVPTGGEQIPYKPGRERKSVTKTLKYGVKQKTRTGDGKDQFFCPSRPQRGGGTEASKNRKIIESEGFGVHSREGKRSRQTKAPLATRGGGPSGKKRGIRSRKRDCKKHREITEKRMRELHGKRRRLTRPRKAQASCPEIGKGGVNKEGLETKKRGKEIHRLHEQNNTKRGGWRGLTGHQEGLEEKTEINRHRGIPKGGVLKTINRSMGRNEISGTG